MTTLAITILMTRMIVPPIDSTMERITIVVSEVDDRVGKSGSSIWASVTF